MNRKDREITWILNDKYGGKETDAFRRDIKRLEIGEPVDYIIGSRPFLGCNIDLSFRPLIPREETEFWVKKAIEKIHLGVRLPSGNNLKILDIFSGSGCIGIALLAHFETATVDFAEIDPSLIKQIEKNLLINKLKGRESTVFGSDCFESIPEGKYDYIFANPPYIPEANYSLLDHSVRDHEPRKALIAKDDGLFFTNILLEAASERLTVGGKMLIEFDRYQKEAIQKRILRYPKLSGEFWQDQFQNNRVVVLTHKNKSA